MTDIASGGHRYSESNSVPVLDFKSSSVPVLGAHFKKYRITLAVLGTFFSTLIKSKIPIFVLACKIKSAMSVRILVEGCHFHLM